MSLWANFALGFTYLSPLVGVYSLFALAMAAGGPAFWIFMADWTVLIGLAVVAGSGLLYLMIARPDAKSMAPSGDAVEVAARLRATQRLSTIASKA